MAQPRDVVKVRLTHKFARLLNGIDVSRVGEGDEMELSRRAAFLLVAEGWADPVDMATAVNGKVNGYGKVNGNGLAVKRAPKRRRRRVRAKGLGG